MLNVTLKQLVGQISTSYGIREEPQAVDAILVNGVLAGYIDRRESATIYGLRPNILEADWPEIAAAVKKLRPDADVSRISGVTAAVSEAANQVEELEDEDDDVE